MNLTKGTLERAVSALTHRADEVLEDPQLREDTEIARLLREGRGNDLKAIEEINAALPFLDIDHDADEQMSRNVDWLIQHIDIIHAHLCPGMRGTWQQRVLQAVEASKAPAAPVFETRQGTVVLLSPTASLTMGTLDGAKNRVEAALPGVRAVVLPPGIKVEAVLHPEAVSRICPSVKPTPHANIETTSKP